MRDSVKMIGAMVVGIAIGAMAFSTKEEVPGLLESYDGKVLVGTGCAKGDMRNDVAIGFEEDELPVCERIDIHYLE